MNKLLNAGFARLWKDTFFRIALFFMLITGLLRPVFLYFDMKRYGYYTYLQNGFFIYVVFFSILIPVFVSLFVGTEYSDGTIRNKLIVGHARAAVYLSNLIVSIAAGLILCIAYLITDLITGLPLLGFFTVDDPWSIVKYTGCSFLLVMSFTALCTLISMLRQSRAFSAVICILGVFFLLFIATYILYSLAEPEYYMDYGAYYLSAADVDEEEEPELIPNPNYVGGRKREIYQFFQDFLPGGQVVTLSTLEPEQANLWEMSLYSVIISVSSTGLGLCLFRKKDIK